LQSAQSSGHLPCLECSKRSVSRGADAQTPSEARLRGVVAAQLVGGALVDDAALAHEVDVVGFSEGAYNDRVMMPWWTPAGKSTMSELPPAGVP
jgi:hypothetical protein